MKYSETLHIGVELMMQASPIALDDAIKMACKIPKSQNVIEVIQNEILSGNKLLGFNQVSMHPSEVYYILQFKNNAKTKYEGIKIAHMKQYDYEVLCLYDNAGAVEIRFYCDWDVV